MAKYPTVFLSYRHQARPELALYVRERLIALGLDVFFDVESINAGRFASIIEREIINRDYFLVILTPTTLESEWVRKEIGIALRHHKPIIPVTADGFDLGSADIPAEIAGLKDYSAIPFDYQYADTAIERIKRALNVQSGGRNKFLSGIVLAGIIGFLALVAIIVPSVLPKAPEPTATASQTATPTATITATPTTPTLTHTPVPTQTSLPTHTATLTYTVTTINTASPTLTATTANTAVPTLLPSTTPTQQTEAPTKGFPCDGQVLPSPDEQIYSVMKSAPDQNAPARPAVRSGTAVRILSVSLELHVERLWYKIAAADGTELGWIPSTYLVPGEACPTQ